MVVEQVDMEPGQVGTVQAAACTAEAELLLAVATLVHVELLLEKSAQLVGSAAVVVGPAQARCRTWELARESTFRRQLTSMSGPEATSTLFDHEEISPASSQAAAC